MKISCPSCSAKYSIADDKVQGRLAKIRCRKCGTSIVIDGNVSPVHIYAGDSADEPTAAAPAAASGTTYSVDLGENDQRQMTVSEIVAAYNAGTITGDTFVWADGFADWTALAQVDEIVAALHAAAQGAPIDEASAAGASTAPAENPWDSGRKAAAPTGGGADLFGSVAGAGSGYEQPAAAVPAASSPFGGGGDAHGARNESSVLFSLSALTSGASASRSSISAPAAATLQDAGGNEDSGLIDLKALTAAAEAMAHVPAAVPPIQSPLMVAPLGGASPLGGMGMMGASGPSIPPQTQGGRNNGLIIGGFLFAAIVAAALIMTMSGGEPEAPVLPPAPVATAPVPTTPVPAALPTPAPTPEPASDAKPPSTGTEQDDAAPKTPTSARTGPRPRSQPSSAPSSAPAPAAAATPAPKPAATGKCGCKKDDLMCLMNCAQ